MDRIKADVIVDAKGLSCPMPIVKTKKAINEVEAGCVLEIIATDKGSKADIKAWAENTGHQYIGTLEDENVLKHYIRKSPNDETIERKHPDVVTNEQLISKIKNNEPIVILDVREEAEYIFSHIPGAVSIPLGDIEDRLQELDKDKEIYVICRNGNRSDFAAQKLAKNGFGKVFNVVPGMSGWTGETTGIQ
ncbi:sulfurtransferase TusA family protein [Calidifontibacillus erzurumensis]|uniref:Sulfurtransferase TusA family protein n=1 Tax=Calidifontibacillus erzurumensis TaxID=2741433 RepID=A0A8J8K8I6_9BACI|nr:sulfurtransferase TusA family protein [Calidifontibacillus erzurumensis]NSL51921.1 sulfurtransferase TusA family protein [Calidifontibacillus erzurumensis]